MGADKTNNIMTLSSGVSQPLLADVQYFELYSSSALNRKLKNIVLPGFYCGFEPVPSTGLSVRITSENSEGKGAASVDVNNVQISVQQIEDVTVSVKAGATNIIVLEANFEHGVKTTQVESASSVSAARIYARTDNTIGQNQIELCRVIVPNGATAVTKEMIVLKYRVNRAVGVEFSNEISSTEERKAATPLAVKTLHDLVDTKAPLDSPHLSGTPTSPTPEPGTNNTQIANAAFVKAAITALINGAPGTLDTLKEIAAAINNDPNFSTTINNSLALKAPLASPAFTGTPTAPTASQGTNSTQIANTAFVKAAITALINGAPGTLDTLKEIAAAINNDPNFSTTINNVLALKAPLASPALTGIPTAPTAAQGTNNTQIATTAYVRAAISALVGSSPEALDTLNELAAALGNDPNFATTMTNALAGKQPLDATLTALAGLATGANKLPYFTGTDTVSQTDLTSVGRDILAKTSVLAVIQYLGLRELGTSGEKIPLLSTANTWSARQTFNGGITGELTGNADTATKLKTARTIGGVSFDGSANIDLPGVNKTGNQNTTGNAATATKLLTARTINGVSFDGSANISLSPANIGCPASPTGWLVTGDNGASITTEQLVTLLRDNGAFNAKAWIARCAWAYANSASIPDSETGCGIIPLAGAVIEVFNNGSSTSYFTIRITTATTTSVSGALTNAEFIYVSNGTSYSPGWRRAYNTKNKPTAADVGALPLSGGALTGGLTAAGEIISKSANGLRIAYGNYGFFIRNDGSNTYFMLTASGDNLGTWNSLRPLIINNANGTVSIGNGLNVTGGINGSLNGNAATATKLQTACTINGVSFDGSKNIELTAEDLNLEQTVELAAGALQKNQNGADIPGKDTFTKNIGACRAYSAWVDIGGDSQVWTTAQFISWLESQGAFNHPYWMCKGSWAYANNKVITDTGCGNICLAGAVVEVIGTRGAMTIRVTTPSTSSGGGITNAQFTYINHGDAYAPGWRRDYNTKNQQPAFALGQTGSTVGNDKAVGWNSNSGVYNATISGASTLILHFNMNAGSCPAVQFRVNYKNGGIYYRSARDRYGFEADWSEFYTTTRKPSAGDVGAYTKAESDSRYVRDIRLGTRVVQTMQKGVMYEKSGHAITGLGIVGEVDGDDPAVFRPIQKLINGTWYNVSQV
ncbi:tail fiber protein [Escherichia coli]|uniref:phage tail fiber protein n=2 Tax=Escherichia coli TaxID=562 RepID=UPI002DBA4E84|nr:tail fiber protein [Escherichia coli]MEC4221403.1 tail fiber protein [Escherichia coli]